VRPLASASVLVALLSVASPAAASQVRQIDSITYASPNGHSLAMTAFLPDDPGPVPGVVVLHGGGWTSGTRGDVAFIGRWLAERGLAAFTIDYRLAPRFPFPAAVRDAQAAVRWIRAHARNYGVDHHRLAAFGVSAGGHLAVMLGVLGHGSLDRGARVRVAASWSGPMDLVGALEETHPKVRRSIGEMLGGFVGCPGICVDRLRRASPINHVDGSDAAVLLASSTEEALPFGQAVRMGEVLDAEDVPHRIVEIPGGLHAEEFAYMPVEGRTVLETTVGFLIEEVEAPSGRPFHLDPRLFLILVVVFAIGAALRAILVPPRPLHQPEVS
jgi:acetyl esterase/lipase